MPEYSWETAWPNPSSEVRSAVIDFWLKVSALTEGKAIERAGKLLVVCRDRDGEVAAVSTAFPYSVESLGLRCCYFRAFVGRVHRVQGLRGAKVIHRLIRESYNVLNNRFQQGVDRQIVGLYLEIENTSVQRHRSELVWSDDGANIVFVGVLPNGRHARVWYFENARVPRNIGTNG